MKIEILVAMCLLLGDLSGRYSGVATGKKADGSGPEISLFLVLDQEGTSLSCTAGLDSFDAGMIPGRDATVSGNHVRFSMPWGGGVLLELDADGANLSGTVRPLPGVPPVPFDRVVLKRVGDLTLSDRIPRIPFEGQGPRSVRMLELRKDLKEGRVAALETFWTSLAAAGAPLVESLPGSDEAYLVTFVWKGADDTKSVLVDWPRLARNRPGDYLMSHVEGTDLWFKTLKVRRGTRISYRLSPNDPSAELPEGNGERKAATDPLNAERDPEGRSLLELPGAPDQPWYAKRPDVPRYTSKEETVRSAALHGDRKVRIHVPPESHEAEAPFASLYLTDGEDPDGLVFASTTLENLLADGRIPPLVVVRVVNADQETRGKDLKCSDAFVAFLGGELVPFVREKYRTSPDPAKTAIGGYSLGGLAAAYAGLRKAETFGLVLSQSGSFWYEPTGSEYAEPNWLCGQYLELEKLPLRFYLDAGTYEIDVSGRGSDILLTNRHLRDVLKAKGYEVTYQEFPGEHDYVNWRGTLADGLIALFGWK